MRDGPPIDRPTRPAAHDHGSLIGGALARATIPASLAVWLRRANASHGRPKSNIGEASLRTQTHALRLAAVTTLALFSAPAIAQQSGLPVPARTLPVPTVDVSPEVQKVIALPLRKDW